MKKLFYLCIILLSFNACSIDDNNPNDDFFFEILPIESVIMPEEFVFGQSYEISVTYIKPSGCYIFNDFYYVSEFNQRTVAIINTVYTNNQCQSLNEEVEVSFNFLANNNETYIFKFWQGEDENGNDLYYIVEVPVIE